MFNKGRAFIILSVLLLLAPLSVAQDSPMASINEIELANIAFKNATGEDLMFYVTMAPSQIDRDVDFPDPIGVEIPQPGGPSIEMSAPNGATQVLEASASARVSGLNVVGPGAMGGSATALMPRRAGAPQLFEELETVRADLGL